MYSLIMNVLLGHRDNFIFSYFFFNFAFLDHSVVAVSVQGLNIDPLGQGKGCFLDKVIDQAENRGGVPRRGNL